MGTTSERLIVLKELAGHRVPYFDPIQQLIARHFTQVESFWIAAWTMTAVVVLTKLWRAYVEHRNANR